MTQSQQPRRSVFSDLLYDIFEALGMGFQILMVLTFLFFAVLAVLSTYWLNTVLLLLLGAVIVFPLLYLYRKSLVFIHEQAIGAIFTRRGNFVCFVGPGLHHINPWRRTLEYTLPSYKQKDTGHLKLMRTHEGIPVGVDYLIEYTLDTKKLLQDQSRAQAYALRSLPPGSVKGAAKTAVRNIFEQKCIRDLYEVRQNKNLLAELETVVSQHAQDQLGGGYLADGSGKMFLGPIVFPEPIERALELAHERELYTTAVSNSLKRLHDAIEQFDDAKIRRLADLEQLRVMASQRNGSGNTNRTIEEIYDNTTSRRPPTPRRRPQPRQ